MWFYLIVKMPKCGLCIISSAHHRRFFLMWFLALGHCHAQGLTSDTERTTSYSHTHTHTHTHTHKHTQRHTRTHTHGTHTRHTHTYTPFSRHPHTAIHTQA